LTHALTADRRFGQAGAVDWLAGCPSNV